MRTKKIIKKQEVVQSVSIPSYTEHIKSKDGKEIWAWFPSQTITNKKQ